MSTDPLYASLRKRISTELSKPCRGRGGDSYRVRNCHKIMRDALDAFGRLGRQRELRKAQPDDLLKQDRQ